MNMKRTTLVLDGKLREEATHLSARRNYSKTVDLSIAELARRARAGKILDLAGSGLWEGDLREMRRGVRTSEKSGARKKGAGAAA